MFGDQEKQVEASRRGGLKRKFMFVHTFFKVFLYNEANQTEEKEQSYMSSKKRYKKGVCILLGTALLGTQLTGCGSGKEGQAVQQSTAAVDASAEQESSPVTNLSRIDSTKWQYNAADKVYYQLGIRYCETPADETQETLAIFVPAAYMEAEENGDGTYSCKLNREATAGNGGYTASTAPIVFPVNTPGYSAQDPLTEYQDFTEYTDQGFIYVHAGCRGRDAGAPAGVTDLKAAIRYIRYNEGTIAGDMDRIFTFGMSGGGAQSVLLGVTGDSALYDDYLHAIGAVQQVSDAVNGSQAWCPITSLESADEAYEWQMGITRTGLSEEEQRLSGDMTAAFADYINELGLVDTQGKALTLEPSADGRYQAGTYYEYIKSVVEESLNHFLEDTEFPYDSSKSSEHSAGMRAGGQRPDGKPGTGRDEKKGDSAAKKEGQTEIDFTQKDDIRRSDSGSVAGVTISGTYETVQDYIDALNADGTWVAYDADTNTVQIRDLESFAKAVKTASKGLAAFDQLDAGQGENTLFGYADGNGAHFDATLADILEQEHSEYADAYLEDLKKTDTLGHTVDYRLNMYSPLYYLMEHSDGYGTSTVASFFRINTGLFQGDTAVTTEANLALALENYDADGAKIKVDFNPVWGLGHTMAERTGNATDNFISWVNACCLQ